MSRNIDALNEWSALVGGGASHVLENAALNDIAVRLGGSGGHVRSVDAANEIATLVGGSGGHNRLDLALAAALGGVGGVRTGDRYAQLVADIVAAGGGAVTDQIIAAGLSSEADLAQTIARIKRRAAGLVTETDLAQAVGAFKSPLLVTSGRTNNSAGVTSFSAAYGAGSSGDYMLQVVTLGSSGKTLTYPSTGPDSVTRTIHVDRSGDPNPTQNNKVSLSVIGWAPDSDGHSSGNLTWGVSVSDQWEGAWLQLRNVNLSDVWEAEALYASTGDTEASVPNPIVSPTLFVPNAGCLIFNAIGTNVDDVDQIPSGWTLLQSGDSGGACQALAVRNTRSSANETVASENWGITQGARFYGGAVFAINGKLQ